MTPNGTGIRNLTNSTQLESKPAWSPDGSVIAYVANVSQTDVHQKGIFVMTSDGSEPFQLATSTAIDGFDWSPDGGWIVYPKRTEAADGFAKGFVVSLDGSKTLEITQGIGDDYSFAWSD
jgi:Tol biopolymer transport system component